MKLILASGSPRRSELLAKLGYTFDVIPSDCDEVTTAAAPREAVKEIALRKALNVYRRYPDCCVVGCDTVVDLDGTVLGKPKDAAEAEKMLTALSGRSHKVHTGVCVLSKNAMLLFADTSDVTFYRLTDGQIRNYVSSGSPLDKAGGYGVQDSGFVREIRGSYFNVMGLPCERLDEVLQSFGIVKKV